MKLPFSELLPEIRDLIQQLPEVILNLLLPGQGVFGRPWTLLQTVLLKECWTRLDCGIWGWSWGCGTLKANPPLPAQWQFLLLQGKLFSRTGRQWLQIMGLLVNLEYT